MGLLVDSAIRCKVKIIKPLNGVFAEYQPVVGGVYDAIYNNRITSHKWNSHSCTCIIDVKDKKICLRKGEYEILEDSE